MEPSKRASIAFLWVINVLHFVAGLLTNINFITGKYTRPVIRINLDLSYIQMVLLDFVIVCFVMMLICVISSMLTTDIPYSPIEVLSNCPVPFLVAPLSVVVLGVINTVKAEMMVDKISLIISMVLFAIFSIINLSCVATVTYDAEE